MSKDRLSYSGGGQEGSYELSYQLACGKLATIGDIEEQCRRAGACYIAPGKVIIDYLAQSYSITLSDAKIARENSETEVPLRDKILILHYFTMAKGTPATGILITYKQLPGGLSYFPVFAHRAITPLVKYFGNNPEMLTKVATAKLEGHEMDFGDASVAINAFSRVPVILVLWRGDEEVAPSANILFDANISDYLSTEDVAVLCETIAWRLVKDMRSA
jgi:hypothetical protein